MTIPKPAMPFDSANDEIALPEFVADALEAVEVEVLELVPVEVVGVELPLVPVVVPVLVVEVEKELVVVVAPEVGAGIGLSPNPLGVLP